MRLMSFSFLKDCRYRLLYSNFAKKYNSDAQPKIKPRVPAVSDPSLIEFLPSWKSDEEPELRAAVMRDMQVFPDFVSEAEETALITELEPYLKRMRYEYDHWDNAIEGYRETERGKWTQENEATLSRVKALAFGPGTDAEEPLPHAHVLDLAAAGHIKPHVDAVRFCGATIAGVCLLSTAVMRLAHSARPHLALDALLQRRSLYIMRGVSRYQFTHAVLADEHSRWRGERVRRARRLAVICRSRPPPVDQ